MATKNAKTVLFVSLVAVLILSLGNINSTQISELTAEQDPPPPPPSSCSIPYFAQTQELTAEQEVRIDEIMDQVVQLQQDNIGYEKLPDTPEKIELIARNLDRIDEFLAQLEVIVPSDPTVEIEPQLKERMIAAQFVLMNSGLPLLEIYIGSSTGLLTITVDQERSTDLKSRIQEIIGEDIPIEIRYGLDTARFQGSCSTSTDHCNPLIDGSLGKDQTNGLDCTMLIAAVGNT